MTDQSNGVQRNGIHAMMDILKNMPLPDSLKKWDQTILLQVIGQEDLYYEWTIQAGQWKITEGKTREPGIILRGREIDFVREFSDINSNTKASVQMLPAGGKNNLSIGDALKYGTLKGNILQKLKGQWSQFSTEAQGRQDETIAVMQEVSAVEIRLPASHGENQRTGIHAMMDILKNMPLPDSHKKWNKTIWLQVHGREEICYEWTIQAGQWKITEGKTQNPDLIMTGNESDFIKVFSDFNAKGGLIPVRGAVGEISFADALKFGSFQGSIVKYLNLRNEQWFTMISETSEPVPYVPILLGDSQVALDQDSGFVRYQPIYKASILDGITSGLLNDRYIGNAATFGIGGNKYANDLKK